MEHAAAPMPLLGVKFVQKAFKVRSVTEIARGQHMKYKYLKSRKRGPLFEGSVKIFVQISEASRIHDP